MTTGYYRQPTIYQDNVVFVSEDDLWSVPVTGGIARRLTSNLGEISRPYLSSDGSQIAFVGREEGQSEIYVMPALGGVARRLTYMSGALCMTSGWTNDGKIIFANAAEHWYLRFTYLYTIDPIGGAPQRLNVGMARTIHYGPGGRSVISRHTNDSARWKRYRGGTAGQIWIDANADQQFQPLHPEINILSAALWIGNPGRIYFIADHEGFGNLYSCLSDGQDMRRHTQHQDFYARNISTDGQRIVYQMGADLYVFDPVAEQSTLIPVEYHSPRVQRSRKFVDAARYLEDWALHPHGHSTAITSRGKLFSFANWEGPVRPYTEAPENNALPTNVRYRLPCWLHDGKRLLAVSDEGGEEAFIIFSPDPATPRQMLPRLDIGRPVEVAASPCKDQIVFSNNRYELLWLDLTTHDLRQIDRGKVSHISGFHWSPDGEWVVYDVSIDMQLTALKLWNVANGQSTQITQPLLRDYHPAFDPLGRYIYFISERTFDPMLDQLQFELSFPRGARPYLITLQKDLTSPFVPKPPTDEETPEKTAEEEKTAEKNRPGEAGESTPPEPAEKMADEKKPKPILIDLEDIEQRIIAFPVADGLYDRILGTADGKVLYTRYPLEGTLDNDELFSEPGAKGSLLVYNFEDRQEETILTGVTTFGLSANGKTMLYRSGNHLRVLKAGEKPGSENHGATRKSGWIDLGRVKVSVLPGAEWRQMFREAWRLQRDQYWTEDMAQIDWLAIHNRYLPLVDRAGSRSEFSELMWEMQGELGTSHAYEFGGDYRPSPQYRQGFLGADYIYEEATNSWRITHIHHGDVWQPDSDSPLHAPGVNVEEGDRLLSINHVRLNQFITPAAALVNLAGQEISLEILPRQPEPVEGTETPAPRPRSVIVKALASEAATRYRQWIETNRQKVHAATGGRIGYVHIPDMGTAGFAEFHRGYLNELPRQGLVVDVRFNRGGFVSQLLLEKLARKRIGYDITRWGLEAIPYPYGAFAGPLVALTNEYAGSDGDIFSHGFKLMKIGPLIGKRTWGGVIGINPRQRLTDGTITTQPEFSSWFMDVGWGLENYGADPDIEIDIRPQDYAQGVDPQLERAIEEALRLLEANPPKLPDFTQRPSRAAPKLPEQ